MENKNEIFEIDHEKGILSVETIPLPGQVLFRVSFPDSTPPLVICRATDVDKIKFWTSVPEGRQQLAAETGPLIEQYFGSKPK